MRIFVETYNLIEGFHKWKKAPDFCAYLRNRHRHLFEIRCRFVVDGADRDIEFNFMQNEISNYLAGTYGTPCEFEGMSCEMIAAEIMLNYPNCGSCTVLEDGYGGATLTR